MRGQNNNNNKYLKFKLRSFVKYYLHFLFKKV